jgi:hypothetical protein
MSIIFRASIKMKNDRGKITAKGENQAVFRQILLININIAWSDPDPRSYFIAFIEHIL